MRETEELNGDNPLTLSERFAYLGQNWLRNIKGAFRGPAIRSFTLETRDFDGGVMQRSPGRLYTDAFLNRELPRLLSPQKAINVLEIGCGSGSMAQRLAALGFKGRYVGVDVEDRFQHDMPQKPIASKFVLADAHAFSPEEPVDLLISVSALEHIADDDVLIARFPEFLKNTGVQVHLVPAPGALFAYLWHGYRQYPPAALLERFGASVEVYRLGGLGSLIAHCLMITPWEILVGWSFRKAAPGVYEPLLRFFMRIDSWFPVGATAYAVVTRKI